MSISARLQARLSALKNAYEQSGEDSINEIRSGSIIEILENWCADELHREGIAESAIAHNFKASGFFKTKEQDVSVRCQKSGCQIHSTMPTLSLNVRSQLSSIQKNYDTLFERLVAEALNLHLASPEHVAGYLYLVPLTGYDEKALKAGRISFTEHYQRKKYVESFEKINLRSSVNDKEWKYERICLLTTDFSMDPPEPVIGLPVAPLDRNLYSGLDLKRVWTCLDYRDLFSNLVEIARTRWDEECFPY
jgi:hypothetical protein